MRYSDTNPFQEPVNAFQRFKKCYISIYLESWKQKKMTQLNSNEVNPRQNLNYEINTTTKRK